LPGFEVIGEEESAEVQSIFDNGGILFRHGFDDLRNGVYKVKEFENSFADRMKTDFSLAVTSGTSALRVALASLGIGRGAEVITQSFTFVATAEAIIESGATPVIADIDKTLNMDPADLERRITPQTKAVIVVHMLGVPAHLSEIKRICDKHSLALIEDTAWGCGGSYEGVPLGTYGDIGTYSFDFAKTMTTGEGGMLVFKNKQVFESAAAWHDHGHENNPKLPRWEDSRSSSGFNFRMSEIQGAVGIAQLRKLDYVIEKQRTNSDTLQSSLSDLPLEFREIPSKGNATCDALIFFVENRETALRARKGLLAAGLATKILPEAISWHFAGTWSHMSEMVERLDKPLEESFKPSLDLLSRSVALPISLNQPSDLGQRTYATLKDIL
jgi:8-amino-3,8-dideoxy-alpha-D-manno-octulosonate transaminase